MTDATNDKRDFFVSFNQADRPWATWIAWVLEEAGYSVFFQDWDFRGNFIEHMNRAHLRAAPHARGPLRPLFRAPTSPCSEWAARFAEDPAARDDRFVTVKVGPLTGDPILRPLRPRRPHRLRSRRGGAAGCCERVRKAVDPTYRAKPDRRPAFPVVRHRRRPFHDPPRFPRRHQQPPADQPRLRRPRGRARRAAPAAHGRPGPGRAHPGDHRPRRHRQEPDRARLRLPPPRRLRPRLVAARRDPGHAGRRLRRPRRPARPRSRHRRPGAADRRDPAAAPDHARLAPGVRQCRGPGAAAGLAARHRRRPRPDHLAPHRLARPRQGAEPGADAGGRGAAAPDRPPGPAGPAAGRARRRQGPRRGAGPPAAGPGPGPRLHGRDRQEPRRLPAPVPVQPPGRLRRRRTEPRLSGELRHHLADLDRRRRGRLPRRAAAAGAAGVPGPGPAADRGAGGRSAALPEACAASTPGTTPSPPCAATR